MDETGAELPRDKKLAPMRAELDRQSKEFDRQQAEQAKPPATPVSAESPPLPARPRQPVKPGENPLAYAKRLGLIKKDVAPPGPLPIPPIPPLPKLPKLK